MCNYFQTNLVNSTSGCCCGNSRWRVQRICYDCQGNIRVVVSNGCVCRRLTYNVWQENGCFGETNTANNNNGWRCGGTATAQMETGGCARTNGGCPYATSYTGGRSCGCGCNGTF